MGKKGKSTMNNHNKEDAEMHPIVRSLDKSNMSRESRDIYLNSYSVHIIYSLHNIYTHFKIYRAQGLKKSSKEELNY